MGHIPGKVELRLNNSTIKGHDALEFDLDPSCLECKEVLKELLEDLSGWRRALAITPDCNLGGAITHWHLNIKPKHDKDER